MRYAHEVENLMAAHPGREFKMIEIRRFVEGSQRIDPLDRARREAVRQGVVRVLEALVECKCVKKVYAAPKTAARYVWAH